MRGEHAVSNTNNLCAVIVKHQDDKITNGLPAAMLIPTGYVRVSRRRWVCLRSFNVATAIAGKS